MPENGWGNNTLIAVISVFFIAITMLLVTLTRMWLVSKENKNKFQILAHTDSLTGIYNRYGFDELAEKMINKIRKRNLWLYFLILMILNLLMISMDMFTETKH